MTRKKIIITVTIIFIIVAGALVGGYFYLTNTKVTNTINPETTGSLAPTDNGITDSFEYDTNTTDGGLPRFRQISQDPVAGYNFVTTSEGYVIWHVERANGNIFENSTSSRDTIRITNTTIPKVYEALIAKNGTQVALRTLDENSGNIQTYIASLRTKSGTTTDQPQELVGSYAPNNIRNAVLSPLKTSFFGILSGVTGGEGILYPFAGNSSIVFSHPILDWVPTWVNTNTILMTTAPSARTQSLAYFFNTTSKAFTKVLGPRNGLVASASPDTSYVLFSENKNNLLVFSVLNIKLKEEILLENQTIPDKCVWSNKNNAVVFCGFPKAIPSGLYPDIWYQGKVQFEDVLGRADVSAQQISEIFDPQTFGVQVDVLNPILSPDEKYLLFQNKRDLTLWMYEF
jgi:hypothetical protein